MDETSNSPIEIIHSAESEIRRPASLIASMLRDLLDSSDLAWRLFVREIRAKYRQSLLGYLWLIIPPIVTTGIWVFLHRQGVLGTQSTDIPYPIYVLSGLVLWNSFVGGLTLPQSTVLGASDMLTKVYFPREALLLASLWQTLFDTGIRLLLLGGVIAFYGFAMPNSVVLAPFGILVIVLFGFSLGTLLIPLGLLYRDIQHGLAVMTNIWFFVTPIVYPAPTAWPAALITRVNPVSPLLITTREMLATGELTHVGDFLLMTGITFGLLLFSWLFYRISMPHLVARMSA